MFRIGRLGQNTIFGTFGLGARAVVQAIYLVILSRWMGAGAYGLFAGSLAAVMLAAPLSGWGVNYLLSKHIAADRSAARLMWTVALVQIAVSGVILVSVTVLVALFALTEHLDWTSMLALAIGELLILPIAQATTSICFAVDSGVHAALAICLVPLGRVIFGIGLLLLGVPGAPGNVALSHFAGSLIGAAASILLTIRLVGLPTWHRRPLLRKTLSAGSSYAAGALMGVSYQEVDKVAMLQLLGANVVGPYSAAFRVGSVFILPISALISAALPRLFGVQSSGGGKRIIKAITIASVTYAVGATLVAIFIAPLMPYIFGQDFHEATKYLILLSPWPILFALHQSAATWLTVNDRQKVRVLLEALGLLAVIALNMALLPSMGASGSIAALLAVEFFLAVACATAMRLRSR